MSGPRFPGQLKARATRKTDGTPLLEIELEELDRLERFLRKQLKREPTVEDLWDYVHKEQQQ